MSSDDVSGLAERMTGFLAEIAPLVGKLFDLVEGSVSVEGGYGAATALSRADESRGVLVRHTILVKLLVARNDDEPQEWALFFHYLNGRLVAPAGFHHMRFVRTEASRSVEWRNMGWETDEYDEWSELDEIDREGPDDSHDTQRLT